MRWYRELYTGPNAGENIQKIRKKASDGQWMTGVYYITLASVPGNLLDIFHNGMLKSPLFLEAQCMDIIGVAQGRMEALRLTERIMWELYQKTGGFDIRSYFRTEDFLED